MCCYKAWTVPPASVKEPTDLAASVHRRDWCSCARDVICGEDALSRRKTVLRTADIYVEARDLAAIIDPEGCAERGARDHQIVVKSPRPAESPWNAPPASAKPTHDLAVSIDPEGWVNVAPGTSIVAKMPRPGETVRRAG